VTTAYTTPPVRSSSTRAEHRAGKIRLQTNSNPRGRLPCTAGNSGHAAALCPTSAECITPALFKPDSQRWQHLAQFWWILDRWASTHTQAAAAKHNRISYIPRMLGTTCNYRAAASPRALHSLTSIDSSCSSSKACCRSVRSFNLGSVSRRRPQYSARSTLSSGSTPQAAARPHR